MKLKEIYIKSADPFERGFQHGSQVKDKIIAGVEAYKIAFAKKGYSWEDAKAMGMRCVPYLETTMPDLLQEAKGIAEGAGIAFSEVMVLNSRYELLKFTKGREPIAPAPEDGECTTYVVEPAASATGELFIGQNWDKEPFTAENLYVIHIDECNGTRIMALTEPAQLVRSGMNNHGMALACSTILSTKDYSGIAIPTNFMRRRLLQCKNLSEADALIADFKPCCSLNYTVGNSKDGTGHIFETTPGGTFAMYPTKGVVTHGNDLVSDPRLDRFLPADSYSPRHFRGQRLQQLLNARIGEITPEVIMECLKDHYGYPASVCNHNEKDSIVTIASTVYCPERGYGYIAWRNPCENDYHVYEV